MGSDPLFPEKYYQNKTRNECLLFQTFLRHVRSERRVTSVDDLFEAVARYASTALEKLCRQHSAASSITVFIATNRFKDELQYGNSATLRFCNPNVYTTRWEDIVRVR
jgi:hypothetical protein